MWTDRVCVPIDARQTKIANNEPIGCPIPSPFILNIWAVFDKLEKVSDNLASEVTQNSTQFQLLLQLSAFVLVSLKNHVTLIIVHRPNTEWQNVK